MRKLRAPLTLCRLEPEQLTLEGLAARAGVHPALVEAFVEYGLLEPGTRPGQQPLFDAASVARLRMIERLRRDLGINLAGIAVILDLRDRLTTLQREVEQWRRQA